MSENCSFVMFERGTVVAAVVVFSMHGFESLISVCSCCTYSCGKIFVTDVVIEASLVQLFEFWLMLV